MMSVGGSTVEDVCGRYVSVRSAPETELFGAPLVGEALPARWNVAPSQTVYTVAAAKDGVGLLLEGRRWGLIPSWAKDPRIGNKLINARRETLLSKPAFRAAAARRRVIVPADSY